MRKLFFILLATILMAGCYHVNIQQGNIINQSTVSQLRLGMNKDKINSMLGAPLLSNMFDKNTWSYVYTNQINGKGIEKKKLTLRFKNNKLIKIN